MKYTCAVPHCPWRKDGMCLWLSCAAAVPIPDEEGGEEVGGEADRETTPVDRLLHRDRQRDWSCEARWLQS